jgi:hypothetical protein
MLAKQLTFLGDADAAGLVLGARVPIILTSRADSVLARWRRARWLSWLLMRGGGVRWNAFRQAHHRRHSPPRCRAEHHGIGEFHERRDHRCQRWLLKLEVLRL